MCTTKQAIDNACAMAAARRVKAKGRLSKRRNFRLENITVKLDNRHFKTARVIWFQTDDLCHSSGTVLLIPHRPGQKTESVVFLPDFTLRGVSRDVEEAILCALAERA